MLVERSALSLLLIAVMASSAITAEIDLVETFTLGTGGWSGQEPTVMTDGGPNGAGDAYLHVESFGGNRPGSRLAIFNVEPAVTGDFGQIGRVEMDLLNPISTGQDLAIRLVLFGPESTQNRWTSITPAIIPADGQWRRVSFPVAADQLTLVLGEATFDEMISDVVRTMIRHDADEAGAGGDRIVANLGVDNVVLRAVPEPSGVVSTLVGVSLVGPWRKRRPQAQAVTHFR